MEPVKDFWGLRLDKQKYCLSVENILSFFPGEDIYVFNDRQGNPVHTIHVHPEVCNFLQELEALGDDKTIHPEAEAAFIKLLLLDAGRKKGDPRLHDSVNFSFDNGTAVGQLQK